MNKLFKYIGCEVEYGYEGAISKGKLEGYDPRYGWIIFRADKPLAPYLYVREELIKVNSSNEQLSGTDQVCGKTELNNLAAIHPTREQLFEFVQKFEKEHEYEWFSIEEGVKCVDFTEWFLKTTLK